MFLHVIGITKKLHNQCSRSIQYDRDDSQCDNSTTYSCVRGSTDE
jgi:hypothetical protein